MHLVVLVSAPILAIVGTYALVENTAEACILGRIPALRVSFGRTMSGPSFDHEARESTRNGNGAME